MRRLIIAALVMAAGASVAQDIIRRGYYSTAHQVSFEVYDEAPYTNAVVILPFEYEWDASTNYLDASESANDGTQATANARPTWVAASGVTNAHYDFDGTDDTIDLPSDLVTDMKASGTGSVCMWVRMDDATPAVTERFWGFGDDNSTSFLTSFIASDGKIGYALGISGTTQWNIQTTATPSLSSATWHHVALTHNGTVPNIYIDGVDVATTYPVSTDLTKWLDAATLIDVGRVGSLRYNSVEIGHLAGDVDDFRAYAVALSTAEVLAIYDATAGAHP